MNNAVFEKAMENVRKHGNIKLVTTDRIVSETNYHTTKFFTENLLVLEMRKTQILMNTPVYLGLLVLDLSKTVMYEFCYDYVKSKYDENAKLCYMDTYSFIAEYCRSFQNKIWHLPTDHYLKDKIKSNWTNEIWIRWTWNNFLD